MGNTKKTRKKYRDNHCINTQLFDISKPHIISMIHTPEGRKKIWEMCEQELKRNPESAERINRIKRAILQYDQLQGVDSK